MASTPTSASAHGSVSIDTLGWWAAWCGLVLIWAAGYAQRYLNHDAAWYLWMARALLGGARLYVDAVDSNPPLIVLLSVPPVWIARLLGVSATAAFDIYVFLVSIGSTAACAWAARRALGDLSVTGRRMLATVALFCVLPFVKSDYGQREHFAVLLSLPFIIVSAGRAAGRSVPGRAAFAIGVLGGIGFAVKPHLLIAWVLVEILLAVLGERPRRWRPETLGVLVLLAAYGAVMVVAFPQYIPFAVKSRGIYAALLNPGLLALARLPEIQLCAVAAAALLLVRLDRARSGALLVLLTAGAGFLLGALVQGKGWDYHLYPARVVLLLTIVACAASLMDRVTDLKALVRGGARSVALLLGCVLLASSARYSLQARRPPARDLVPPLLDAVRGRGRSMYALQMLLYPGIPVLNYSGMTWAGRHNSQWFLPGFYTAELSAPGAAIAPHTPEQMSSLEHEFFTQMVDDLCLNRPDVLIVENGVIRGADVAKAFDLLAYYRQDPRFVQLLGEYGIGSVVGDYTIYTRRR